MRTYDAAVLSAASAARMQSVGRTGTSDASAPGRFDGTAATTAHTAVVAGTVTA